MSWEDRMAARAAERQVAADVEDYLREIAEDPHGTHHQHLDGSSVRCSCGTDLGVTSVVIEGDYDPDSLSCRLCGERGVAGPLGED